MTAEARYTIRIGESRVVAEDVPYEAMLDRIVEFTVRAAVARSLDEYDWEQESVRRGGLRSLQIFRDRKALWGDRESFEEQLAEARRENVEQRFRDRNALDVSLWERLDRDLRARWRGAGYQTPSLVADMKKLFTELQRELGERTATVREGFVREIVARE